MEFKKYRKKGFAEMRPYIPGESLQGISVSDTDSPSEGDMIARNPENHHDMWLVDKVYFNRNFEPSD